MTNDQIIILILCILNLLSFGIGLIIGKIWSMSGVYAGVEQHKSFFTKEKTKINSVSIDDTKFVVDINTKGLEKKYTNLGETKQSSENIETSVNKLKNMKG